jgi:hypothetical protein
VYDNAIAAGATEGYSQYQSIGYFAANYTGVLSLAEAWHGDDTLTLQKFTAGERFVMFVTGMLDLITIAVGGTRLVMMFRGPCGGLVFSRCFVGETLVVLGVSDESIASHVVVADRESSTTGFAAIALGVTLTVVGVAIAVDNHRRRRTQDIDSLDAAIEELLDEPEYPDEWEDEDLMSAPFTHPMDEFFAEEQEFMTDTEAEPFPTDLTYSPKTGSAVATAAPPKLPRQSQAMRTRHAKSATASHSAATRTRGSKVSRWFLPVLLLFFGIAAVGYGLHALATPAPLASPPAATASKYDTQPIRDVRVGAWVLARNPEVSNEEREHFEDIVPSKWRQLTLRTEKADGSSLDIVLLRPTQWLEAQSVEVGATLDLDLEEMGVSGRAEVLAIDACPPLAPRPSPHHQVVTGKFVHSTGEILDLYLAGLTEPIGTTPNHRFWSADRQAFLPASDLQPHEQLLLADGTHATLARSELRPGRAQVFNLEVDQEHVYYVSQLATLVHNAYPATTSNAPDVRILNPVTDPVPRVYKQGHPGKPVVDHVRARAAGGHPTDPNNLHVKPWEWNSRKGAYEGQLLKARRDYIAQFVEQGMSTADAARMADEVLASEWAWLMNDVMPRPIDPNILYTIPNPGSH